MITRRQAYWSRTRRVRNPFRELSAFFIIAAQALTGCSSAPYLPPAQGRILVSEQIKVGASRADVVNQLGAPVRQETQGMTEFLFYRLTWQFESYQDERNPIAIKDDKVIGFGKTYYETVVKEQQTERHNWLTLTSSEQ